MLSSLFQRHRYSLIILRQLVKTDFKLRYQGSVLGYVWSLLKPLMIFVVMYAVFVRILKVDYGVEASGVYLLLGLVVWSFFTESTGGSVTSVAGKGDLLRKLNFPRYVLVLSTVIAALINMVLNLVIVAIFMAFAGVDIGLRALLAPLFLVQIFALCLALSFFLSALFVRLRDVGHIWEVVSQVLFYATPIFFPLSLAPDVLQKVLILNPLAQSMQDLRYSLISPNTETIVDVYGGSQLMRLVPVTLTVILLVVAGAYFRNRSKTFAEVV